MHKYLLGALEKQPIGAAYNEFRERLAKRVPTEQFGKYSVSKPIKDLFEAERAKDKFEAGLPSKGSGDISSDLAKEVTDSSNASTEEPSVRASTRVINQERLDSKQKWQKILEKLEKLAGTTHHY